MTKTASELARRLSRSTRRKGAKVSFEGEDAFGPDLRVRRWRLGNGLRVLTLVDRAAPVVSFQTWLGVGSRRETKGKTGLAHFCEHLMFLGTERFPVGEIDRRLEEVGAEHNAATWTDWTCYYEDLPSGELGVAMELEADRLANLDVQQEQLESEREVVLSERRDRVDDDVEGQASEVLWSTLLRRSPYSHPTIGWEKDIRGYTLDDCRAFHRTWYAPNNAMLVAVGDLDEESFLESVVALYGALTPSKLPVEEILPEPTLRKEKRIEMRLSASGEKAFLGWHGPAFSDPDWAALNLLSEILFGGRSARVYRELVVEEELATELSGSIPPFALPSVFEVSLAVRPRRKVEKVVDRLDAHLERVRREPVTDDELERAKARLELGLLSSLETANGKGDQLGFYAQVTDQVGGAFTRLDEYRALRPDDLLRAARRFLDPKRRVHVRVLPS
ncbi:MAG: insulinase family protein [Sandaracinus sp.]|nr:insulinase family protein [Sandaracinus sp.]